MALVSDTQKAAGKLARYVEEFQEFFASHKMHCGSSNDLLELSRRMEGAGTFRDELSSMVRSVIFREGGNVPRAELLKLVTTSIGGAQLDDTAGHLQEPISQLMSYLTGVVRAPKNQPIPRDIGAAATEHSLDSAAGESVPEATLPSSAQEPATFFPRGGDSHSTALSPSQQEATDAAALLEAVRLVELKNLELKSQLGSLYERISRMDTRPEPAPKGNFSQASLPEVAPALPAPPLPAPPLPRPALPVQSRAPAEYLDAEATDESISSAYKLSLERKQSFQPQTSPASIEEQAQQDLADREATQVEDEALDNDPWNENSDLQKVLRRFAEQKAAQDNDLPYERPGLFARIGSSGYVKWFAGSAVLLMLMLVGIALRHHNDTASLSDPVRIPPGVSTPEGGLPKPNPYDSQGQGAQEPSPRDLAAERPDVLPERSNQAVPAPPHVNAESRVAATGVPTSVPSGDLHPSDKAFLARSQAPPVQSDAETIPSGQGGGTTFPDAAGKNKAKLFGKIPYSSKSAEPLGLNVSSGVMAGNLISAPAPQYPKLASFTHVQGQVLLQAIISKNGTVEHLHVVRGHRLLRGAAMDAVQKWRYRPYVVDGRPVDVATIIRVDFQLHR